MEHQQGFLLKESREGTAYNGKPIRLRRNDGPGETAESSSLGLGSVSMFTPYCPARSRTFYSTTFYNEWHPRSMGFQKMDGLMVRESAHCADGPRCVAQGGQGDFLKKNRPPQSPRPPRKGPQLSHARLEGPNRRARTCAPAQLIGKRKRWRPCRRLQEATSAGANSTVTTPFSSSHAAVTMTLLDQNKAPMNFQEWHGTHKGLEFSPVAGQ